MRSKPGTGKLCCLSRSCSGRYAVLTICSHSEECKMGATQQGNFSKLNSLCILSTVGLGKFLQGCKFRPISKSCAFGTLLKSPPRKSIYCSTSPRMSSGLEIWLQSQKKIYIFIYIFIYLYISIKIPACPTFERWTQEKVFFQTLLL